MSNKGERFSRVFVEPKGESFRSFELETFSEEEEQRKDKKVEAQNAFKREFESIEERAFVLGGFDFEYHGGYKHDEILKKTSDEVEKMIGDAKNRVESIEKEAREKGYSEGSRQGRDDGISEVKSVIESLNESIVLLMNTRMEFFEKSEKEMIDIIILTATEIIRREVQSDREIIKNVIRKSVEEIHSRQTITIRLNPRDIVSARELASELVEKIESLEKVEFEEDTSISDGGCFIKTNVGILDATVENRLLDIYANFKQKVLL